MKRYLTISLAALALAACSEKPVTQISAGLITVEPVITRATEVNFETGDKIGLTVLKSDAVYAQNALLAYGTDSFAGDLVWYNEGSEKASFTAYYPYSETGAPSVFKVSADQAADGFAAYDLMAASKTDVLPTASAVTMVFRHLMTKIVINVNNQSGEKIKDVVLKNVLTTANVDIAALSAQADETAAAEGIKASEVEAGARYVALVPPQTGAFSLSIVTEGSVAFDQKLVSMTLKQGGQYSVDVLIAAGDLNVAVSGEIENWTDEGGIQFEKPEEILFEEHLDENYFIYHNEKYSIAEMKDGKVWMTSNLRYVPDGLTPCKELTDVTAGVYFPLVLNAGHTAVEFSEAEADIVSNGYLYQSEVALGLKVGDITSVAQAEALEGTQGICPAGWHIPTSEDIINLVGKALTPFENNTSAPYYDAATGNSSIALLNADGFNAGAWGTVSIPNNTSTAATKMGWQSKWPEIVSSGFVCGSTYAGVTYNTKDDEASGVKNIQFLGFMPMPGNGTFNGSKLSYRMGASVRCVRNN